MNFWKRLRTMQAHSLTKQNLTWIQASAISRMTLLWTCSLTVQVRAGSLVGFVPDPDVGFGDLAHALPRSRKAAESGQRVPVLPCLPTQLQTPPLLLADLTGQRFLEPVVQSDRVGVVFEEEGVGRIEVAG